MNKEGERKSLLEGSPVERTLRVCQLVGGIGAPADGVVLAAFIIFPQHPVVIGEGGKMERRRNTKNYGNKQMRDQALSLK